MPTFQFTKYGDAIESWHQHMLIVHKLLERKKRELQSLRSEKVAGRIIPEGLCPARKVKVANVAERAKSRGNSPNVVDLLGDGCTNAGNTTFLEQRQ